MIYHPCLNELGNPEPIHQPTVAGPLQAWHEADQLATAIPESPMPHQVNGIVIGRWSAAPRSTAAWEALAEAAQFAEPEFVLPAGTGKAAAGAVVVEADGRVWVVSPTNQFGGYRNTFAKGTREAGMSLRATAIKEAYEEAGLQIELTAFLVDVDRTTSRCRFYLARRIGGDPAAMGWESQAVHLVPRAVLGSFVAHAKDAPVVRALWDHLDEPPGL